MPLVTRVTDIGIGTCSVGADCCPHTYTFRIVGGDNKHIGQGQPVARIGDPTTTTCPHCPTGRIITGRSNFLSQGKPVARVGDRETCGCGTATILTGQNSYINDSN